MKIYILLGHPDPDSFNGAIARSFAETAQKKGHEVRLQQLGALKYDPILWHGYKLKQQFEPDLIQARENLLWCEHWVIVYPMWWGSVPALLKGFLDRVLTSGFAFKYRENSPMWDKLLSGRSGRLIATSDAPWWWIWLQYRNSDFRMMKKAVLEFCGIKPVQTTRIDRVRFLTEKQKQEHITRICNSIPVR